MKTDLNYRQFTESRLLQLITPRWWQRRLARQYENRRTEPFHFFRITWQEISRNAYRPGLSRNPRHFILHLLGLRAIESVMCEDGFYISVFGKKVLRLYWKGRQ